MYAFPGHKLSHMHFLHTDDFVSYEGSSLTSLRLKSGTWPGKTRACSFAKFVMNVTILWMSANVSIRFISRRHTFLLLASDYAVCTSWHTVWACSGWCYIDIHRILALLGHFLGFFALLYTKWNPQDVPTSIAGASKTLMACSPAGCCVDSTRLFVVF